MEVNKRDNEEGGEAQTQDPLPNPSHHRTRGFKAKSCKGCMYYSSVLKSQSKYPTCVGFSRSFEQVSSSVGKTALEASKDSSDDFKYACVGYSIYLDNKDSSADQQDKIPKLPLCVGLKMMVEKLPRTAAIHDPAPAQKNNEHEQAMPQRRYEPPNTTKEEYFNRFKRNTRLVASGVVRNLYRVGNDIKDSLEDILNPNRRRPK